MARRDMWQVIERGRKQDPIPTAYGLTFDEVTELMRIAKLGDDRRFGVITNSFEYGYRLGQRAERAAYKRMRQRQREKEQTFVKGATPYEDLLR